MSSPISVYLIDKRSIFILDKYLDAVEIVFVVVVVHLGGCTLTYTTLTVEHFHDLLGGGGILGLLVLTISQIAREAKTDSPRRLAKSTYEISMRKELRLQHQYSTTKSKYKINLGIQYLYSEIDFVQKTNKQTYNNPRNYMQVTKYHIYNITIEK